jgi:hypothetical protein
MPTLTPVVSLTSILVDPAVVPLVILSGLKATDPVPMLITSPPPVPVAFRIVALAPAPRNVTVEGTCTVPVME